MTLFLYRVNNQWCGTSYSFQTRSVSPQKPSLLNKTNIHCRNKLKYIQFTPILCSFHLSSNSAGVCKKHVKYDEYYGSMEYLHNTAVEVLVHSHQQLTRESLRKSWLRERGERWWRGGDTERRCPGNAENTDCPMFRAWMVESRADRIEWSERDGALYTATHLAHLSCTLTATARICDMWSCYQYFVVIYGLKRYVLL